MKTRVFGRNIGLLVMGLPLLCLIDVSVSAQTQYTFTKIVETGDVGTNGQTIVLPGHNFYVSINDSGTIAFQAGNSLWTSNGSPPVHIYMGVGNTNVVGPGVILDSGEVAFVAQNSLTGSNLFLGNGGTPTLVANGGTFGSSVAANNSRSIAVVHFPSTLLGFSGIQTFAYPEVNPATVFQCPAGFNCVSLLSPSSMNQSRQVAFARLDQTTSKATQILRGTGNPFEALLLIAQAGGTVEGRTFDSFDSNVSINTDGWVAFAAYQVPDFQTGIYVYDESQNKINRLVDTQQPSPFLGVNFPVLNESGKVAFHGQLGFGYCGTLPFCNGIYTGPDPLLHKVAQAGDIIDGKTILDVDNSYPPAINKSGQIVVKFRYLDTNGFVQYAVYRADPVASVPSISLSPASLTFGNQQVGSSSSVQSITVSSAGTAQPLWVFAVIKVWSRLWPSTVVSKRSYQNTLSLFRDLSKRMNLEQIPLVVTDGFGFYEKVVGRVFVPRCLYVQVIKTRRKPSDREGRAKDRAWRCRD